jgi:hypothetical protein
MVELDVLLYGLQQGNQDKHHPLSGIPQQVETDLPLIPQLEPTVVLEEVVWLFLHTPEEAMVRQLQLAALVKALPLVNLERLMVFLYAGGGGGGEK